MTTYTIIIDEQQRALIQKALASLKAKTLSDDDQVELGMLRDMIAELELTGINDFTE